MALLMIRHGATTYNSRDRGKDRIRGWKDLPLSPEGHQDALTVAAKYAHLPLHGILSSDLKRAHDTAKVLHAANGAPLSTHQELRPWHLGDLTGQHSQAAQPLIDRLVARPQEAPPNGESLQQFLSRFLPFILPFLHDPRLFGVVTHIRDLKALEAHLAGKGKGFDLKTFLQPPKIHPGEAAHVTAEKFQRAEAA